MLLSDIQGSASSCPWPSGAFNPERGGAGEEALGAEIGRDLNEEIAAPCALPARGARGLEGLDHGTRFTHLLREGVMTRLIAATWVGSTALFAA